MVPFLPRRICMAGPAGASSTVSERERKNGAHADRPQGAALPPSLAALIDRFDASAIDVPRAGARIRLIVAGEGQWDVSIRDGRVQIEVADGETPPDASLATDAASWERIARDLRGGMDAFRAGRLVIRHNLNLGVGMLAATSGASGPERLRFQTVDTVSGPLSVLTAGAGEPVVLVHGLGATKGSFLPTVAALAGSFRVIALDLPGFGDSVKPLTAPYDAPFFARSVIDLLDALALPRAHIIGNSLGGRIALELGLRHAERIGRLVLLAPSLAWKRERPWAPLVRVLRPELGLVQMTPRWAVETVVHRILPVASKQLGAGGGRRVPAVVSDAARTGRVLRRGTPDLPGGTARCAGFLDAPRRAPAGVSVHLGSGRLARSHRIRLPRAAGAALRAPPRAGVRPRAAARASDRDSCRNDRLPAGGRRQLKAAIDRRDSRCRQPSVSPSLEGGAEWLSVISVQRSPTPSAKCFPKEDDPQLIADS